MKKIYFVFAFLFLTIFWLIVFLINPLIILNSEERKIEIYNPSVFVSNNNRTIAFTSNSRKFLALCSYLKNKENEFCEFKNSIDSVIKVNAVYAHHAFSENMSRKGIAITSISYKKTGIDKIDEFVTDEFSLNAWKNYLTFSNKYFPLFFIIASYVGLFFYFVQHRIKEFFNKFNIFKKEK